jgi:transposase InsO family protein
MSAEKKIIKGRVGLLKLAEELGKVSQACKVLGYSRETFYRYKELFENGGELALQDMSRRKPLQANRVETDIEEAVVAFATEQPAYGQPRVSNELKKRAIFISPGGVRSIWLRHDLETFKKRLKALEVRSAQHHLGLTEAQLKALEKSRQEQEAHGEIETEHPGYLIAQDTFYVGNMKGVGRIYQQTVLDTYSRVAFAKLYDRKNALVATDMLNDKVLPWFESQEVAVLRVLTDRGTEYLGNLAHHQYELYLAVEDIDHSKTKAYSPQTHGFVERFHKTMLEEFYQVTFRKKVYTSLEQLQTDVDEWLEFYNRERPHSGRYCYGKTPLQTFRDSKHLADQKQLDKLLEDKPVSQDSTPQLVS